MADIIEINQKRYFTIDDARGLLPIVQRITEAAYQEVNALSVQISYVGDKKKKAALEERVRDRFQEWYEKIRKLGCESKGLWLVDFDNGEGYYCWHYPEPHIEYFHGYFDGYQGRIKIN